MIRLQDNPKYKSLLKDFYLSGQVVFDFLDLKRPDQMGLSAFWSQFAKKGLPALECLAEELNAFYGAEIDYQPVLTNSPVDAGRAYMSLHQKIGKFMESSPNFNKIAPQLLLEDADFLHNLGRAYGFVQNFSYQEDENRASLWLENIIENNEQMLRLLVERKKEKIVHEVSRSQIAEKIAADMKSYGIRLEKYMLDSIHFAVNETCYDVQLDIKDKLTDKDVAVSLLQALQNHCQVDIRSQKFRDMIGVRASEMTKIISRGKENLKPYYEMGVRLGAFCQNLDFVSEKLVKRNIVQQKFLENQNLSEPQKVADFSLLKAQDILHENESAEQQKQFIDLFQRHNGKRALWHEYDSKDDFCKNVKALQQLQRFLIRWSEENCRQCADLNVFVAEMSENVAASKLKSLNYRMAKVSKNILAADDAMQAYLGLSLNDSGINENNLFCDTLSSFGKKMQVITYRKLHQAFMHGYRLHKKELEKYGGKLDSALLADTVSALPLSLAHRQVAFYAYHAVKTEVLHYHKDVMDFKDDCVDLLQKSHKKELKKLVSYLELGSEEYAGLRRLSTSKWAEYIDKAVVESVVLPLYCPVIPVKPREKVLSSLREYTVLSPEEKKFVAALTAKYSQMLVKSHKNKIQKNEIKADDRENLQDLNVLLEDLKGQYNDVKRLKKAFVRQNETYKEYKKYVEESKQLMPTKQIIKHLLTEQKLYIN